MNNITDKSEKLFSLLPPLPVSFEGSFDCREGCIMRYLKNVTENDFNSFLSALANEGFEALQKRDQNGNMFAAYKKGCLRVNAFFTPCDSSMRVTAAENELTPRLTPDECEGTDGTVFYAFENDQTLIDCGMCLLVQCPDHSFFIVDSGHYFQPNDNDRIYKFMRERTPEDKKVTVCGWFITHAHTDHVSKLMDFLRYNTRDVIIEGFYQNLLPSDYAVWNGNHEEPETAEKLFKTLEAYPAPVYKLHTGMRFYVRNLTFDVMSTFEDIFPEHIDDYNDSSCAVMMSVDGSRVFIPGDASLKASKKLESRWGNTLKCDVVQISHHGHTGLSSDCYRLIGADTAIFPVTRIIFENELPKKAANRTAIDIASQHFITGDGTVCVPLPYKKESVTKLPDETMEDFAKIERLWKYKYSEEYKTYIYSKFLENGGSPEKLLLPTSPEGWIEPK
ncbi:MAG: hypothetical protein J1E34_00270 [Oscillospiraceae bacterium]|nr:hypothetical protein [Oscillospiraceae bacterium]